MIDIIAFVISTWYIWAIVIIAAILGYFSPKIKGFLGEKSISLLLSRLDQSKYKVINNVLLRISGKTSQIDHIVVSNYGIFVIETKNYKGWIIGDEYSEYWTQVIYKHKEKLYNPLRQNYGHIQALKTYLSEYPSVPYFPIVAFTSRADLKITTTADVVYSVNVAKTIRKYNMEVVTDKVRNQIVERLSAENIVNKVERKQHIRDIHGRLVDFEGKEKNGICPKCGGYLVQRKGKYGSFKGCSNYPKCRFTS